MKCQNLFSGKKYFKMSSAEIFPSMLSVKYILMNIYILVPRCSYESLKKVFIDITL